jgi:hypothetical protein
MVLKFGKHAGRDIRDIPAEYLKFLFRNSRETLRECEIELKRRGYAIPETAAPQPGDLSAAESIIVAGVRSLAKTHHPDVGGDAEKMTQINLAAEWLRNRTPRLEASR